MSLQVDGAVGRVGEEHVVPHSGSDMGARLSILEVLMRAWDLSKRGQLAQFIPVAAAMVTGKFSRRWVSWRLHASRHCHVLVGMYTRHVQSRHRTLLSQC